MSKGIYVALSGAVSQEVALDVTAANVANSTSAGYQKLRPQFRRVLVAASRRDLRFGAVGGTSVDTQPGTIRQTGRPLDLALPAGSYLGVTTPRGERYTRCGALQIAADGTLRTSTGAVIAGENGQPLKAPVGGGEFKIDGNATLWSGGASIGKLRLVKFDAPQQLQHEGGGLFSTGGGGAPQASTDPVEVGFLEESNAPPVQAMTDLLTASRTFEAFQRAIETFGEVDRKILTVPGVSE
jgi:flagellar basal body rod protein FlgG